MKVKKEEKRNDYFLQRGFTAEFRAAGEDAARSGHRITGLAAVYEQETVIADAFGEFTEVIRSGAFDECDFDDVRLLVNHDMSGISLARSRRNNKSDRPNTMQLTVDENGVNIDADLDTVNNEQARALYSAIDRGDMDGMSFCFFVSPENQRWNEDLTRREILKVDKVIEVSVVNFPAYGGTNINSRSLDSDRRALDNARAALDNAKKKPAIDYRTQLLIQKYKK